MKLEINPTLDIDSLAKEFNKNQKLRIENFFLPDSAEYILENLKTNTPWHLVHSDEKGLPVKFDPEALARLDNAQLENIKSSLYQRASSSYQYLYKYFPIIDSIKAGTLAEDSMLSQVASFVNSTQFIGFSRALTRTSSLVKFDPQASLYQPGHFLSMHDDSNYHRSDDDQSSRRFAVVLGFTKNWSSNWGGQTSFYANPNAAHSESWDPGFNVLSIFRVPIHHRVGFITPFAAHGRYSITGWLRDDPRIKRYDLGDT